MPDTYWLDEPEPHSFPAAESYLLLIRGPVQAATIVEQLRSAAPTHFKAKDIFQASALFLHGVRSKNVDKDRGKISSGKLLSPLPLVRDAASIRPLPELTLN